MYEVTTARQVMEAEKTGDGRGQRKGQLGR